MLTLTFFTLCTLVGLALGLLALRVRRRRPRTLFDRCLAVHLHNATNGGGALR